REGADDSRAGGAVPAEVARVVVGDRGAIRVLRHRDRPLNGADERVVELDARRIASPAAAARLQAGRSSSAWACAGSPISRSYAGSVSVVSTVTSDAEVVRRCRSGDAEAWNELVERFSRYVYAICTQGFRLQQQDAEDVFQEVFARVYVGLDRLRSDEAIRP